MLLQPLLVIGMHLAYFIMFLFSINPALLFRSFESDVDLHSILNSGPEESEIEIGSSLLPSSQLSPLPLYPPPGHSVPVSSRENASQFAEHTMTRNQRRLVRNASGKIRVYDLGWKRNWLDLFSVRQERFILDWVEIIWWGGRGCVTHLH